MIKGKIIGSNRWACMPGLYGGHELGACEQDRGRCGWGPVARWDWTAGQRCSSPGCTQQSSGWPRPHPRPRTSQVLVGPRHQHFYKVPQVTLMWAWVYSDCTGKLLEGNDIIGLSFFQRPLCSMYSTKCVVCSVPGKQKAKGKGCHQED